MKLEEILDEYERDSVIDLEYLERASRDTPRLHAKYLRLLAGERLVQDRLRADLDALEQAKTDRLNGVMPVEELRARGWEPERRKLVKEQVARALAVDKEVVEMRLRAAIQREKVSALDGIVRFIVKRNFDIGGAIDVMKFKAGAR